ncbi:Ion transport domain-containing protein [Plasmodiophora brassicae]|nr:hypothetical protein PBRA_004113 [Plasmodiophora brassicae]
MALALVVGVGSDQRPDLFWAGIALDTVAALVYAAYEILRSCVVEDDDNDRLTFSAVRRALVAVVIVDIALASAAEPVSWTPRVGRLLGPVFLTDASRSSRFVAAIVAFALPTLFAVAAVAVVLVVVFACITRVLFQASPLFGTTPDSIASVFRAVTTGANVAPTQPGAAVPAFASTATFCAGTVMALVVHAFDKSFDRVCEQWSRFEWLNEAEALQAAYRVAPQPVTKTVWAQLLSVTRPDLSTDLAEALFRVLDSEGTGAIPELRFMTAGDILDVETYRIGTCRETRGAGRSQIFPRMEEREPNRVLRVLRSISTGHRYETIVNVVAVLYLAVFLDSAFAVAREPGVDVTLIVLHAGLLAAVLIRVASNRPNLLRTDWLLVVEAIGVVVGTVGFAIHGPYLRVGSASRMVRVVRDLYTEANDDDSALGRLALFLGGFLTLAASCSFAFVLIGRSVFAGTMVNGDDIGFGSVGAALTTLVMSCSAGWHDVAERFANAPGRSPAPTVVYFACWFVTVSVLLFSVLISVVSRAMRLASRSTTFECRWRRHLLDGLARLHPGSRWRVTRPPRITRLFRDRVEFLRWHTNALEQEAALELRFLNGMDTTRRRTASTSNSDVRTFPSEPSTSSVVELDAAPGQAPA